MLVVTRRHVPKLRLSWLVAVSVLSMSELDNSKFRSNGIVCAGNWIVDIVHSIDHWPNKNDLARITHARQGIGGGAANVLTNLAELQPELPLFPVGCIGQDDYGRFVQDHCQRLGVETSYLVQLPDAATAHTHECYR